MKLKALILQISIAFLTTFCFANENHIGSTEIPHGINLSNAVLEFCKSNNVHCETQNLVSNVKNEFPYNISISFPSSISEEAANETLRTTLLIEMTQEDAYKKPEILKTLFPKLSEETRDFDIKIILTFGDNQIIQKNNSVQGSATYLGSLDEPVKYSCLLVTLDCDKSIVVSGTNGMISPTWFVKSIFSAFEENHLLNYINKNYISYAERLSLFKSPIQKQYLDAEIPCVDARFAKDVSAEIISNTIYRIIENYNVSETYQSDHHATMYSIFSKQFWMTEDIIIKTILISLFVTLLIIFTYGFINESFRFIAWNQIRKIWHYPFAVFFLAIFMFIITREFLKSIESYLSIEFSLYVSLPFLLGIPFIAVSLAFITSVNYAEDFKRRTVDYLILITVVADLFLFCLFDISLFPIFAFEVLLAIISTFLKRNLSHFIILALYELPFLPFILHTLYNVDSAVLRYNLYNTNFFIVPLALVILPQYIIAFRLFTGFSYYWIEHKSKNTSRGYFNTICLSFFSLIFLVTIISILPKTFSEHKTKDDKKNLFFKSAESYIDIKTNKRYVFGDVIRTINITSKKEIEQCDLRIKGEFSSPILFSDYDYVSVNSNEDVFLIPYEPPSKMEFSYGESESGNDIIITVIYSDYSIEKIELNNLD